MVYCVLFNTIPSRCAICSSRHTIFSVRASMSAGIVLFKESVAEGPVSYTGSEAGAMAGMRGGAAVVWRRHEVHEVPGRDGHDGQPACTCRVAVTQLPVPEADLHCACVPLLQELTNTPEVCEAAPARAQ